MHFNEMIQCLLSMVVAVIVVGSVGWLVFIAMLGVLIYYRRSVSFLPSLIRSFIYLFIRSFMYCVLKLRTVISTLR